MINPVGQGEAPAEPSARGSPGGSPSRSECRTAGRGGYTIVSGTIGGASENAPLDTPRRGDQVVLAAGRWRRRGTAMRYWICWCLVVLPACAVHAQVVLPPIVGDHGVQYAAEALGQVTKARVTALVAATQGGPEAYDIMPEGTGYRVRAGTPTGLMYGLLELRDRLRFGPTVTAIVHGQPCSRAGLRPGFPLLPWRQPLRRAMVQCPGY